MVGCKSCPLYGSILRILIGVVIPGLVCNRTVPFALTWWMRYGPLNLFHYPYAIIDWEHSSEWLSWSLYTHTIVILLLVVGAFLYVAHTKSALQSTGYAYFKIPLCRSCTASYTTGCGPKSHYSLIPVNVTYNTTSGLVCDLGVVIIKIWSINETNFANSYIYILLMDTYSM